MTKTFQKCGEIGGGGGLAKLAPDLTWPSAKEAGDNTIKRTASFNPAGSLTTALSLSGKFFIGHLRFVGLSVESVTIKLTVDGVAIWNASLTATATITLLGGSNAIVNSVIDLPNGCDSSFLLEIQTTADTSVQLEYLARPIL